MTDEETSIDGVSRRTVMKASPVAVGALGVAGSAAGSEHRDRTQDDGGDGVDEPDGYSTEVLAEPAAFSDDLAAMFTLAFEGRDEDADPIGTHLADASNVVFFEANWEPDGTTGWHRHPGPVVVSVAEGELELVWRRDGVERTYGAGDAFLDPGAPHVARNTSDEEAATAYALALGVPDEQPVTKWVEPEDEPEDD